MTEEIGLQIVKQLHIIKWLLFIVIFIIGGTLGAVLGSRR